VLLDPRTVLDGEEPTLIEAAVEALQEQANVGRIS
jgi:hypothetical protein